MRFFTVFLLFILSLSTHASINQIIQNPETIIKGKYNIKKAKKNLDNFCHYLDSNFLHLVCNEVFEGQLFPYPAIEAVLMIRLQKGTIYKHNDDHIAYFSNNENLIIPNKQMNVTEIVKLEKKYKV